MAVEDPRFEEMTREELEGIAADYGINPADYPNDDDLRAALVQAHEAQSGDPQEDAPEDFDAEPTIHEATREIPWITIDLTEYEFRFDVNRSRQAIWMGR